MKKTLPLSLLLIVLFSCVNTKVETEQAQMDVEDCNCLESLRFTVA
jgi:hypothetical protein